MSQLATLIWLKWTIFKNSLRSSKAAVTRIATLFGMLLALTFALMLAAGLGAMAFALTRPEGLADLIERRSSVPMSSGISAELIFFAVFAFSYLIWATLPLSTGSGRQFDPGSLLMYPISLKKLFALDFISELTTLQSIFAIPAILAMGLGAGLGTGIIWQAMLGSIVAAAFGLALTKWLTISIGSLTRKRRSRGESLIAIIGAVVGLGAALLGQVAPMIFRHAEWVKALRWTPPGAAAFALTNGLTDSLGFASALIALVSYTVVLVVLTYWIARRAALGIGGAKRKASLARERASETYAGWELPLVSEGFAAVFEKELRYILRNAQVKMMALMPLILIIVRLVNTRRFNQSGGGGSSSFASEFLIYGEGLIATGGVLYVFLILSGLLCNQFAFEEGGMRALILSPTERWKILAAKNLAVVFVAMIFSAALLVVNQIIFGDLTTGAIFFVVLSFVIFAALMSVIGNWLSIRFPKRMKFGKRMNVSGPVGLLLIPMILIVGLPPVAAAAAGYIAQSLIIEYVTLLIFAGLSVLFYALMIESQGELLQRREVEVLEAVREPMDE